MEDQLLPQQCHSILEPQVEEHGKLKSHKLNVLVSPGLILTATNTLLEMLDHSILIIGQMYSFSLKDITFVYAKKLVSSDGVIQLSISDYIQFKPNVNGVILREETQAPYQHRSRGCKTVTC